MGKVKITSGTLGGRVVSTPPGEGTRPLLGRARKSLADLLRPRLVGARVVDLFGGSGAVAFELVSNGAAGAVVVELDPRAARVISDNAASLGIATSLRVEHGDALELIPRLGASGEQFDVVVVAPPYGHGLQQAALDAVGGAGLVASGGLVVVQRDRQEPETRAPSGFETTRIKTYGRTVFEFFEPNSNPGSNLLP